MIVLLKKLLKILCIGFTFILGAGLTTLLLEEVTKKITADKNLVITAIHIFLAVCIGYFMARKTDDYISRKFFK